MNQIVAFAAAGQGTIFDHIFDFFRGASALGESWGGPWGILLPVLLIAFFAVVVVSGVRYATQQLEQGIFKPLLLTVVVIGLVVLFSKIQDARPIELDNTGDAPSAVPGEAPAG